MTRERLADVRIEDDEDFEAVLAEAVEKALETGVDVRGAWAFETAGSTYNWEVEIVELARELDADDEET